MSKKLSKELILFIIIFTTLFLNKSFAQEGSLDLTFNPNDFGYGSGGGVNNSVNTISLQPDGKIVFAGQFDEYNTFDRDRAARVESNGLIDPTFTVGDGFNDVVRASAVQGDGKIVFGGDFTQFNNQSSNRILRLNANGSIDNSFAIGAGAGASVFAIAIQPDGKIIIGGSFSSYSTTFINRIVRLNSNGSVDNTFSIGTGPNNPVRDILILPDGKIIIAGLFTSYNGNPANRIARLNSDGSFDNTFNIGDGANNLVHSVAIQPDNKLVISGSFTSYNGNSINRIARINADGSFDNTFNVGTGANAFVIKILLQPDGKVFALGDFISFNGQSRNRYARLNNDGSIDDTFLISSGANTSVLSAALQPDGKIVLGGLFALVNGTTANGVVRLNPNGSIDNSFNQTSGANNSVEELAVQNDGKILVGGNFQVYNGVNVGYLTRVINDGSIDNTFSGFNGVNGEVKAIAIQPDNKILIGGSFSTINGIPRTRIARLNADGSLDETFNPGTGFDNVVEVITLQADGKILVGGNFVFYNGSLSRRLVRLNSNGTFDNTFNVGMGSPDIVKSIVLRTDGKIVIAGASTYNDTIINGIAALNANGSIYNGFTYPSSSQGGIEKAVLQPNGKIITYGSFSQFNGLNAVSIIRLNEDGSVDNTFSYPTNVNNPILAAAIQPNGKIIIGGVFTNYNGSSQNYIARLNANGTLDNTFISGSAANAQLRAIALQNNGQIMIGGLFTSYNGIGRNRIARLNNCSGTTFSTINATSCNAYTAPNGQVFTSSGTYNVTIPNSAGCDSVITLNLNIGLPETVVLNETVCNSFVAPNGNTLTNSGTYNYSFINNNGCDSIIQLNLTIVNSSQNSITVDACNSYTANNGEVYTTSGIYTQSFINSVGCDSTLTLNLFINYSNTNNINVTGCTDYIAPNGQTFTQEGTYTVTIPTFYGCDSVITINLELGSLDISVNQITAGFQANESQAIYQWLDCSNNFAPIQGEVNSEYFPNLPGDYAVQISKNGCVDTSECYTYLPVNITERKINSAFLLFPNPTNHTVYLKTPPFAYIKQIVITDFLGKTVSTINVQNQELIAIDVSNLENGVYFINVLNLETLQKFRFIKHQH
jgi:uncharacterized delta-60 repeat protein